MLSFCPFVDYTISSCNMFIINFCRKYVNWWRIFHWWRLPMAHPIWSQQRNQCRKKIYGSHQATYLNYHLTLFHVLDINTGFGCGFFRSSWLNHRFWLRIVPFTEFRHTDFDYRYLKWGSLRVWPVSSGCLFLLGTWSYLRICQRSMLPFTRFCNCLLDYDYHDYILHIVNFAILY